MKQFEYQARRDGQTVSATLAAESEQAARQQLESQGFKVISLGEVAARGASSATAAAEGLPIDVVLDALADDLGDRRLRSTVQLLAAELKRGASVEQSLDVVGDRAPRYLAGVLRAATSSDELAEICESFVRIRTSSGDAWLALWQVLLYPVVLLVTLTGLAFLFDAIVFPAFADIFAEFDLELPPITDSLLSIGPYLPWLLMTLMLLWLAVVMLPGWFGIGYQLQSALPAMGTLFTSISHEQFAVTLGSLLKMRFPLPLALTYTGDIVQNRSLGNAAYRAAEAVERGSTLADAIARSRLFDRSLAVLVEWGEDRSRLPESMMSAATMYVDRRRQRTQLLSRIVPPLALVLVATSATAVASALLLPLVKLIEGLT